MRCPGAYNYFGALPHEFILKKVIGYQVFGFGVLFGGPTLTCSAPRVGYHGRLVGRDTGLRATTDTRTTTVRSRPATAFCSKRVIGIDDDRENDTWFSETPSIRVRCQNVEHRQWVFAWVRHWRYAHRSALSHRANKHWNAVHVYSAYATVDARAPRIRTVRILKFVVGGG